MIQPLVRGVLRDVLFAVKSDGGILSAAQEEFLRQEAVKARRNLARAYSSYDETDPDVWYQDVGRMEPYDTDEPDDSWRDRLPRTGMVSPEHFVPLQEPPKKAERSYQGRGRSGRRGSSAAPDEAWRDLLPRTGRIPPPPPPPSTGGDEGDGGGSGRSSFRRGWR